MHEHPPRPTTESQLGLGFAVALAIASACAYGFAAAWPAGTHGDELKKAEFVLSGRQDFLHPILMLQLARLANGFAGITDPISVLAMTRNLSAAFGGLLVFATYLLGRTVLAPLLALAVSAAVAVCPLVAVHATFFKEDIFLAPAFVLAVAALVWLVERPGLARSLVLGIAIGVAASAKYIGAILLPLAIVALLLATSVALRERLRLVLVVSAVALAVFAAINAPLFTELDGFRAGLGFELGHAARGHDVRLPISATFGLLHLVRSLAPGLGVALLAIGLAGLAAPIADPTKRRPLAIILCMALLWYAVHEISPLKPFPDFERYMVPLAPLLLVLGASLLASVARRAAPHRAVRIAALVLAIAAAPALYRSVAILEAARLDPRAVMPRIAFSLGANARLDRYTSFDHAEVEVAALDPAVTGRPLEILVTSDLLHDRFVVYGDRGMQSDAVARARRFYETMLARPHLVIANGGPPYAFLNPTLRIVSIDGDTDRLRAIGAAIRDAEPRLSITTGP